jgi:hypothetical protein
MLEFNLAYITAIRMADSLTTIAKELSKYELDLVGVQEVRWDRSGIEPAPNIHYSIDRGMRIMNYVLLFSYIRESYQQLRG